MKGVELYGRVRYAVQIEGLSERAAARRFGLDPRTTPGGTNQIRYLPRQSASGPHAETHRERDGKTAILIFLII